MLMFLPSTYPNSRRPRWGSEPGAFSVPATMKK
jgi:hypothetical protein